MIRMVLAAPPLIVHGWASFNSAHALYWWDGVAQHYHPVEGAAQCTGTRSELTVGTLSGNGTIQPGIGAEDFPSQQVPWRKVPPQQTPSSGGTPSGPTASSTPATNPTPPEPLKSRDGSGAPRGGNGGSPYDVVAAPPFLPRRGELVAIEGAADSLAARRGRGTEDAGPGAPQIAEEPKH